MEEKTFYIRVAITTDKPDETVMEALKRGIYRGLKTPHNYVASPKNVEIAVAKHPFTEKALEALSDFKLCVDEATWFYMMEALNLK